MREIVIEFIIGEKVPTARSSEYLGGTISTTVDPKEEINKRIRGLAKIESVLARWHVEQEVTSYHLRRPRSE